MTPTHYTGMANDRTLFAHYEDRWFIKLDAQGWHLLNYVPRCTPIGEVSKVEFLEPWAITESTNNYDPYKGMGRRKGD